MANFLSKLFVFPSTEVFIHKNALLISKVCTKQDNGELEVDKKHKYYYQRQGQMLFTGVYKCVLVAYTNKGIEAVDMSFDA